MICYVPWLRTIVLTALAAGLLWYKTIAHVLGVLSLTLAVLLAVSAAAAVVVAAARVARAVQRRRAAVGACTQCRFRCQLDLTAAPVTPAAWAEPPAGPVASHQPGRNRPPSAAAPAGRPPLELAQD
jgi:hypothetical protein